MGRTMNVELENQSKQTMATLLNEATDNWSFDKLIQPLSDPDNLQQLVSYLNGKHASYQHDHIDPIALSRIVIALKFVASKKKLSNTLKPFIDELMNLCYSIIATLKQNNLSESSPWLWLDNVLICMQQNNKHHDIYIDALSQKLSQTLMLSEQNSKNGELPQYLFPEWSFCTKSGSKIFSNHFVSSIAALDNADSSSSDDDFDVDLHHLFDTKAKKKKPKQQSNDKSESPGPQSRTFSNVDFLTFPRPKIPETNLEKSNNVNSMRKRQKISSNAFVQIEQNRLENERLKRMEREKIQREENEKLNRLEPNDDECFDDFDSFMNDNNDNNDKAAKTTKQSEEILQIIGDKKEMLTKNQSSSSSDDESLVDMLIAPGLDKLDQTEKKEEIDPEVQKLIDLGIPIKLHSFKWLYTNCNQLTQQNREKIVAFMTGQYTMDNVEKEDVLLNRMVDTQSGITKDSVFRMMFASKKWKKVVLSKRFKRKVLLLLLFLLQNECHGQDKKL